MKYLISLIYILFMFTGLCQEKMTLNGYVFDIKTKEPLIGANVYVIKSKSGTATNESGYYSLTLPKGDTLLVTISFIGYNTQTLKLKISEFNNFYLIPGIDVGEITVTQHRNENFIRNNETSVVKIQPKQIDKLPNFFGESDIIKALQLTPGIQSGGEGKSDLYVRGGSSDQNLILLDGVPLYYVAHFGGFLSIFNTDAVSDINMIKGGFPARFGNKLSSVLEIRMKEGNSKRISFQGTVGLLSSKLLVEGPIVKEKSSFMFSIRKNLIPVFKIFDTGTGYNFYDLNAKLNYKPTNKDKLILSFYMGNDNVSVENQIQINSFKQNDIRANSWGNKLASINWNHVFSKKLFGNNTFAFVSYHNKNYFNYSISSDSISESIENQISSGINDFIFKTDFNWFINPAYNLRFGQMITYHEFIPNNENYSVKNFDQSDIHLVFNSKESAFETSLYAENNFSLNKFGGNFGARFSSYHADGQNYFSLEPRILLNYIPFNTFSVKYSYSQMNQYIHMLSYSGVGMPNDYWMPSNEHIEPENSIQNTLGINTIFFEGLLNFSLDFYHKKMKNLLSFKEGESLVGQLENWTTSVEKNGEGVSKGVELFLQKPAGKTSGWIGTTLSKSDRYFVNLNNGKPFPHKYDRLLDLSIVVVQELTKGITLSGNWTYGTGYPVTITNERYPGEKGDIFVYDEINSFRMRDYHRLDLGLNIWKKTSWGEQTWTLSIFNVYNRKNPYYYYFNNETINNTEISNGGIVVSGNKGNVHLYQKSLFSFFPSFAYSFKF